jgi:hypothetical protein
MVYTTTQTFAMKSPSPGGDLPLISSFFTGVPLKFHSQARSKVGISCFRELPRLLGWRLALSAESQWPQNPSIQHPE